jgi:hypothetical protein
VREGATAPCCAACAIAGSCAGCAARREHIGFLVFFDGEPTSETYGQRVKSCPGCGKQLGLSVLYLENRPG